MAFLKQIWIFTVVLRMADPAPEHPRNLDRQPLNNEHLLNM